MKKLILLIAGFLFLFSSCEKEETEFNKLNGVYVSNTFVLANFDSVKINLAIDAGVIDEMSLTPVNSKYGYVFWVDSIFNNTVIYFHFYSVYTNEYTGKCVWTEIHNGTFEIIENGTNNYALIGDLNVKRVLLNTYRWRKSYIYFN